MKQKSFPLADSLQGTAERLQCFVLDGRSESDRAWIETESGLGEAVKTIISNAPRHNRRRHHGSSTVLSLMHAGDPSRKDAVSGANLLIEGNRIIAVCYGSAGLVEDALEAHAEHDVAGASEVSGLLSRFVTALVRPVEAEITRLATG